MSPDPVLVERLKQHGQSHLLRWWGELNEDRASPAGVGDRLDRLRAARPADRRAGARRRGDGPAGRPGPADRGGPAAADRRRARGPAPGGRESGPTRWPRARSASSWWPAARARGWASRDRRGLSRSGRSPRRACSRSTPRRSSPWRRRHGRPIPLYIMTSPENHEATIDFFESQRPVRPGARPVLHPGADAGRRPGDGQGAAGVEGPGRALARRPRRHAGRPGRARARRDAELPGRDARARRADALLLPGG